MIGLTFYWVPTKCGTILEGMHIVENKTWGE